MLPLLALAVGCRAFAQWESLAGVVGASFCFVSFTIPLVDVDFVVVVVVSCFDVWGPWSKVAGGGH